MRNGFSVLCVGGVWNKAWLPYRAPVGQVLGPVKPQLLALSIFFPGELHVYWKYALYSAVLLGWQFLRHVIWSSDLHPIQLSIFTTIYVITYCLPSLVILFRDWVRHKAMWYGTSLSKKKTPEWISSDSS